MGLDMYLFKAPKIEGLTLDELIEADHSIRDLRNTGDYPYELIKPFIKNVGDEHFHWESLKEEVAYWRKANAVHSWFVTNVQDGEDDCGYYSVSVEDLKKLRNACSGILEKEVVPADALPTQNGFFFGNTDYDEYYYQDLEETVKALDKILRKTDFDQFHIIYHSSW